MSPAASGTGASPRRVPCRGEWCLTFAISDRYFSVPRPFGTLTVPPAMTAAEMRAHANACRTAADAARNPDVQAILRDLAARCEALAALNDQSAQRAA